MFRLGRGYSHYSTAGDSVFSFERCFFPGVRPPSDTIQLEARKHQQRPL
jgi:hypothetical protein